MANRFSLMSRLRRDERGVAVIEFSLWVTLFFMGVSVAMDFGSFYLERGKMNQAVSAAAVSSFTNYDNVNFNSLPNYVKGLAGETNMSVTTSCNGVLGACTNASRTCSCLKGDGTYVSAACGTTCSGTGMTANSTAGYYLTIRAQQTFQPLIVPSGMLDNAVIAQQATVRLE